MVEVENPGDDPFRFHWYPVSLSVNVDSHRGAYAIYKRMGQVDEHQRISLKKNKADRHKSRPRNSISHHAGSSVSPKMLKNAKKAKCDGLRDIRTYKHTDRPTDTVTYRVVCPRMNKEKKKPAWVGNKIRFFMDQ